MGVDQEIDNFYYTIQTINNTLYTLDTELEPLLEQLDGALANLDGAVSYNVYYECIHTFDRFQSHTQSER